MTTKELLDEYARLKYLESEENEDVTEEQYQEIIKELEASIRKEVVEELVERSYGWPDAVVDTVEAYALSKGITTLN